MTVVLLTGASRGIGASIVEVLLSNPTARIVAIARSESNLKELQKKYGEDKFQYIAGDVTDSSVSKKAVELAILKFGQLNSLILNAGVLDPVESIENLNADHWKKLFDINFFSVIELTSLALPELKKTKGSIILVSSGASTGATHGWAAYGSSKLALNHFCMSVALENPEVRTISVAPGVVDTKMQKDIREVFGSKMTPNGLQRFIDLKEKKELLDPIVPATIYSNLALKGIDEKLNGVYLRYSDERLKQYSSV